WSARTRAEGSGRPSEWMTHWAPSKRRGGVPQPATHRPPSASTAPSSTTRGPGRGCSQQPLGPHEGASKPTSGGHSVPTPPPVPGAPPSPPAPPEFEGGTGGEAGHPAARTRRRRERRGRCFTPSDYQ